MEGACGVRLKADDNVAQIFKNGREHQFRLVILVFMKLLTPYLAVNTFMMIQNWCTKGIEIVSFLSEKVKHWKAETGYALVYIPHRAKTLCDRFCR